MAEYTIDKHDTPRYQRENTRVALKLMGAPNTYGANDPEHLNSMQDNKAELDKINAKDKAIQERHARMLASRDNRLEITNNALLHINSWSGKKAYAINVTGETKKSYRFKAMEEIHMPGNKWLEKGEQGKAPKDSVTFIEPVNRIERNDGFGLNPTDKDLKAPGRELGKSGIFDKTNALETKSQSPITADVMADIAKDRGWENIKVSGTENFKAQVWEKAAEQGIKIEGYRPTENQRVNLANKAMAKSFSDDPDKAVKQYPELKDAKEILKAIANKTKQDGLNKKQQEFVQNRALSNISKSIEQGNIPKLQKEQEPVLER